MKKSMTVRRYHKQLKKLVFKQYNGIMKMAQGVANNFGVQRLPLKTVNEIIDKAIVKSDNADESTANKVRILNGTFETLKNVCRIQSRDTLNDDQISINELQFFVNQFKESFLEGLNQPPVQENSTQ